MNREDIIRMAREAWLSEKEAQLITEFDEAYISCTYLQDLEKFAALVASAEREACAKVCEQDDSMRWSGAANAIRARGNIKQFEPCPFIECDCDGNHPLNQPAIRARGNT